MSGLIGVTNGSIEFHDTDNSISSVYQIPRLLDWRTVQKNLEIVLEYTDIPESQHDAITREHPELVNLDNIMDSHPRELSGGMQSCIALIAG